MLIKIIVILILGLILYCLGSGLYFLVREKSRSDKLARALTWRIVLSFSLFALILIAYFLGWIKPHWMIMSH